MITMDAGARRWTVKTARENYWRVFRWYDLDDLIQDGAMHFCRIARKYPEITNRAHLMSLYQRTYVNHIHDLSKRRTRAPEEITSSVLMPGAEDDTPLWDRLNFGQPELATLHTMIAQAPATVRAVLSLLSTDEGRQRLARPYRVRTVGRETLNERLCRLVGVDPTSTDLVGAIQGYFATAA
jgi:hypothetical protein